MSDIVLTTFNARYWHSAFGLRYLLANMQGLQSRTTLLEFGISDHAVDVLSSVLEYEPRIVGVGVYIWNVEPATRFVADLKRVAPEIAVVLGGPEVSYETSGQKIVELADFVISGEGDLAFPDLCRRLLSGEKPQEKIIHAPVPRFSDLQLPYELYTDDDVAHRVIYVEASRGCPFTCEFCLSALEIPVRMADVAQFLAAMQRLIDRGARQFKFVDRTFNLNVRVSSTILEFFLNRLEPDMFLHFEMIPDRLPEQLRAWVAKFPSGTLQFEIGVQTFNSEVGERISRSQDNAQLEENFRFLREETGVHIHADLIVGLPGETLASFAAGFDRLLRLRPHEIQVGILKRLRGTPIVRHDAEWEIVYSDHPPYEILSNKDINFATLQRLRRFARFWDLVGNSGNFARTSRLICESDSPFRGFMEFCDWTFQQERRAHGIPLSRLAERVFEFLTQQRNLAPENVARATWEDYTSGGRKDRPKFLAAYDLPLPTPRASPSAMPPRQARHAGSST
jgi:radical SAM superfamily enzyme YgiQ (UPF0313 family)